MYSNWLFSFMNFLFPILLRKTLKSEVARVFPIYIVGFSNTAYWIIHLSTHWSDSSSESGLGLPIELDTKNKIDMHKKKCISPLQ